MSKREVVLYTLLSLDGVAEEPSDWMFDVDDEIIDNLRRVIERQDDVLLGRGTYDYWAGYWPTSDNEPFASFINGTPKHVFSSRELGGGWEGERRVDGGAEDYVRELKQSEGGDIGVHGSIALAQSLLAAGLVDRLELVVVPTVAGGGRPLFPGDSAQHRLTLEDARRTRTGAALLTYTTV